MVVLIKILQVILALSVLILIHELGHFLFAKQNVPRIREVSLLGVSLTIL